ncbi:MAG TPA: ABC transporter permease [Anaerolineales bacterium]|nr:ABC transporter permease [Anaerolineales bacterium]
MMARRSWEGKLIAVAGSLVLLLAWQWAGDAGMISTVFFPQPSRIAEALTKLAMNGDLGAALAATGGRFVVGLLCGGLLGAVLGLLMGWWPRLYDVLNPFIAAVYPIPKIAIFPLLLVVFGIGERSKYVVVSLSAFFPMLITCLAGVRQINKGYFEVGRNYGAAGHQFLTRILIPGSLPSLLAGLRLSANMAFVIAISVEIVAAQSGLGVLLWYGWQTFRVAQIYAVLVVIAVIGLSISFLIDRLTHFIVPWMGE